MLPQIHAAKFGGEKPVAAPVRLTVVRPAVSLTPESPVRLTEQPKRKRAVKGGFDRVAYQREYMRKRRAQQKEKL